LKRCNGLARRFPRGLRSDGTRARFTQEPGRPHGLRGRRTGRATGAQRSRLAGVRCPTPRGSEERDTTAVLSSEGNEARGTACGESCGSCRTGGTPAQRTPGSHRSLDAGKRRSAPTGTTGRAQRGLRRQRRMALPASRTSLILSAPHLRWPPFNRSGLAGFGRSVGDTPRCSADAVAFKALPARTQESRRAGGGPSWRHPQ